MIIGSEEELRDLGHALIAASQGTPRVDPKIWPPKIADFRPVTAGGEFTVSFHLETAGDHKPITNFPDKVSIG
jgi:hypothetical protein